MNYRHLIFMLVPGAMIYVSPTELHAQRVVFVPRRVRWAYYDPYYAITSHVHAQANLIRAQGDAAVSYSIARNLNAAAYSKELDNWKKRVRTYWDTKILAEQKHMEYDHVKQIKRMKYLNDKKWENSRTWERLKDLPELSDADIRSGKALNFILHRLIAVSLPYEFNPDTNRFGPEALREVSLNDEWLASITLSQGAYKFRANKSVNDEISLWPYLLRWSEFDQERSTFEVARNQVLKESNNNGQATIESIQKMQESLLSFANAFHRNTKVKRWVHDNLRYSHFNAADRFLHNLDREIVRLEQTGDIRPFQGRASYDPPTDGKHVISLLTYMNRNGIDFAPAEPGDEWAYYDLYASMMAIYLTVAEYDESIKPVDLNKI